MKPEFLRMNLLNPLFYINDESMAPEYRKEDGEKLFCFEIEESQANEFQPDREYFPGALIFSGKTPARDGPREPILELPRGYYVFCQVREILSMEEIIDLTVEVQNEGLWQRLKLASRFYLRFLFEDGRGVTQIWRPVIQ